MSSWTPSILVALSVGEERSVLHLLQADSRGLELQTTLPLRVGEEMEIQARCSAGARRVILDLKVRIESRTPADRGHRVRFAFLTPDVEKMHAMLSIAREMGLLGVERTPPPAVVEEVMTARVGTGVLTFLINLRDADRSSADIDQLMAGALMIATEAPPATDSPVLLRVLTPSERALWFGGRVVYQGEISPGVMGVGIALDNTPELIRRELRARRR